MIRTEGGRKDSKVSAAVPRQQQGLTSDIQIKTRAGAKTENGSAASLLHLQSASGGAL